MKKIFVVNLNPSIDRHCVVEKYTHGGLNRIRVVREDIAGKGINVVVALKNLGAQPFCTGFNFSENGATLTQYLDEHGVRHDFVETSGAIRTNVKLLEESTGIMTELNAPGAFVCENSQEIFFEKIKNFATDESAFLVISGSRPQGVAAHFYARLCEIWRGRVLLDTEGEALLAALSAAPPFLIKPNLFELTSTFGVKLKLPEEIANFCVKKILPYGVKIVCVSMGASGAVLVTPTGTFHSPALKVQARGVAGAGDAMVAGLAFALAENFPQEKLLPAAMAAAAASVMLEGTQMCTRGDFENMMNL